MPLSFSFLFNMWEYQFTVRDKIKSVINLMQKREAQPWPVLVMQVISESPERELPFAKSMKMGHAPAGKSLQAALCHDACLNTMPPDLN